MIDIVILEFKDKSKFVGTFEVLFEITNYWGHEVNALTDGYVSVMSLGMFADQIAVGCWVSVTEAEAQEAGAMGV